MSHTKTTWTGPTKTVEVVSSKRKPLRRQSAKQAAALKEYGKRRVEFLSRPENFYCPVMKWLSGYHIRTTQIHYMARRGKNLNNEATWLAVSASGHNWIETHPNEARKKGWLK